jgi:hypothetical protein
VYDIADHAGGPFLTMEFVDGGDLAGVLRRLGRLPEEKAVEVARQLCGALAAVHDQGLLHRDLKPANVMLDGRGRVRLADFGLAAAAADLSGTEVRSGTPLYQAPEQRAGREVTARSDLYALGLVLYEVFTGRRPYPGPDRDGPPSRPSGHVTGLDPAVEAVILDCLALDPAGRPRSAAAVLARLPGGDPLAAAVAEGRTPSPQVVAAADVGEARLRPAVVLALVAAVIAGVLACGWAGSRVRLANRTPLREAEPAVMRFKAREALAALGHDEPPGDAALRYYTDFDFILHHRAHWSGARKWDGRWEGLGDGRPPAIVAFYRTARGPLVPTDYRSEEREFPGPVGLVNPPAVVPGMADVLLDLRGRLLRYHRVGDPYGPEAPPAVPPAVDWRPAFAAAGLDHAAFAANPVPPRHCPPLASDARFAWIGPYPGGDVDGVRVEAASLAGRPVYFVVEFPWQGGGRAVTYPGYDIPKKYLFEMALLFLLPLAAAVMAAWNWREGRADLRGAMVLMGVMSALWAVRWVLTAHHVAAPGELTLAVMGLGIGVYESAVLAVFYLALEPAVRKRWPGRLVGWTRLLAGRVRDPLVGRDVLVGLAAGMGLALFYLLYLIWPVWAPDLLLPLPFGDYDVTPARCVFNPLASGLRVALTFFFVLFLAHRVCRNRWLALAVFYAFAGLTLVAPAEPKPWAAFGTVVAAMTLLQFVALRFGLLAFGAAGVAQNVMVDTHWTLDVGAWYATGPNLGVAVLLALTVYAAYTACGGWDRVRRGD